jgi:hypothetical protein
MVKRLRVRLRSENEQCVAHFCAMWVLSAELRVSAAALTGPFTARVGSGYEGMRCERTCESSVVPGQEEA